MARPSDVHTFEFADVSGLSVPAQQDEPRPSRRFTAIASMAGVLLSLLLLLGVVSSGGVDPPAVADDENPSGTDGSLQPTTSTTSTTAPPTSAATNEAVFAGDGFVFWPNPPEDWNLIVIGRPGPDLPVFGEPGDLSVVYVNSLSRATVIELDTGRIEQVDVAPQRAYDYFGIEFGRVVSFDGQNRNLDQATDRALLFHTHRAQPNVPTSEFRSSQNPSPHLCLSPQPCANETWTFENVTNGTDTIRRANETDDPEIMEMLFGDSWTVDGLNRSAPASFGFDFRVPTPLNDEVWIVHQPRGD